MASLSAAQRVYAGVRRARSLPYRAASVIDWPANVLNGKRPFPPLYLRRDVGALNSFESSAGAMVANLKSLCVLRRESRLLDMGCGCGAVALVLRSHFDGQGGYVGIDVDDRMISWCQRHLSSPRFRFTAHPYWNALYNPSGDRFLPFPVEDESADVVLMKSVFTHMLPGDVVHYISELARILAPGARGIITAFIYSAQDPRDAEFPYRREGFKHAKPVAPESKLALPKDWLLRTFDGAGIDAEVRRVEFQDDVIIQRR
jgi:SAM-dependent methyltransferase